MFMRLFSIKKNIYEYISYLPPSVAPMAPGFHTDWGWGESRRPETKLGLLKSWRQGFFFPLFFFLIKQIPSWLVGKVNQIQIQWPRGATARASNPEHPVCRRRRLRRRSYSDPQKNRTSRPRKSSNTQGALKTDRDKDTFFQFQFPPSAYSPHEKQSAMRRPIH